MTIKIFICSYKTTDEKEILQLFNKKSPKTTFLCWTRLKTKKPLATAKSQFIRKKSVCCLKNQAIFFTV